MTLAGAAAWVGLVTRSSPGLASNFLAEHLENRVAANTVRAAPTHPGGLRGLSIFRARTKRAQRR